MYSNVFLSDLLDIEGALNERKRFLVRASYLQIYNEVISDLLKPERTNLHIREDKKKGVFVEGLSEWVVRNPKEVYGLMQRGAMTRATASTKMNEISSRSHAVFIIICEQSEYIDTEGSSRFRAFLTPKLLWTTRWRLSKVERKATRPSRSGN